MILPPISGLGFLHRLHPNADVNLRQWSFAPDGEYSLRVSQISSHSVPEVCDLIGDALLKFNQGDRFSNYIPDLAWNVVKRDLHVPPTARHLISQNQAIDMTSQKGQGASLDMILDTILHSLDVSRAEFSPNLSFVSYGLDSFGATRISHTLRPHANVSQMQLLGGMTREKILQLVKEEKSCT